MVSINDIDINFGQVNDGNFVMKIEIDSKNIYIKKKYKVNVMVDALVFKQFLEPYKYFYLGNMKNQKKSS